MRGNNLFSVEESKKYTDDPVNAQSYKIGDPPSFSKQIDISDESEDKNRIKPIELTIGNHGQSSVMNS